MGTSCRRKNSWRVVKKSGSKGAWTANKLLSAHNYLWHIFTPTTGRQSIAFYSSITRLDRRIQKALFLSEKKISLLQDILPSLEAAALSKLVANKYVRPPTAENSCGKLIQNTVV
jgi:hypothetical protein